MSDKGDIYYNHDNKEIRLRLHGLLNDVFKNVRLICEK